MSETMFEIIKAQRFEPLKNANIFKTSYQPSEKISAASHKCNSRTTKDWSSKILKDAV